MLKRIPGHPQTWKVGRDNEYVQSGEGVCSQDRVCSWQARRDQAQQGLLAGTLKAQWGKHSMRNDLLGGSRSILESAGVFYMTAGIGIPGATHKKRGGQRWEDGSNNLMSRGGSFQVLPCLLLDSSEKKKKNRSKYLLMWLVTSIHATQKQKDLVVELMGVRCVGEGARFRTRKQAPIQIKANSTYPQQCAFKCYHRTTAQIIDNS